MMQIKVMKKGISLLVSCGFVLSIWVTGTW